MKKMVLSVACVLLYAFLSGCAADRKVIGNTFQSDYPKLNIQIDPEFKYLDKIHNSTTTKSIDGSRETLHDSDLYFFVSEDTGHKVKKLLYIYFGRTQHPGGYIDMTAEDKNNLDFGVENFNSHNFKYYKRIIRPQTSSPATKYYMDAGYIVPSCVLTNAFYIIPYKDLWVTIFYLEDATPSGMSCKNKYSINTLSERQKGYLAGLHGRAQAAIGIGAASAKQSIDSVMQQDPKSTNIDDEKPLQRIVQKASPVLPEVSKNIKTNAVQFIPISDDIIFKEQPKRSDKPEKSIAGKCEWNGSRWSRQIMLYNGTQKRDVTQKMIDYVMNLNPDYISKSQKSDPWETFGYKLFNKDSEFYQNASYPYR